MKPKMYSRNSNSLLHDHILDGFHSTHEGLRKLKDDGLVSEQEYLQLLEKNIQRLVARVKEFRLAEKLTCIFFALLFSYMQVNGEDMDMRRSGRARTGRTSNTRARNGRRSNEGEAIEI